MYKLSFGRLIASLVCCTVANAYDYRVGFFPDAWGHPASLHQFARLREMKIVDWSPDTGRADFSIPMSSFTTDCDPKKGQFTLHPEAELFFTVSNPPCHVQRSPDHVVGYNCTDIILNDVLITPWNRPPSANPFEGSPFHYILVPDSLGHMHNFSISIEAFFDSGPGDELGDNPDDSKLLVNIKVWGGLYPYSPEFWAVFGMVPTRGLEQLVLHPKPQFCPFQRKDGTGSVEPTACLSALLPPRQNVPVCELPRWVEGFRRSTYLVFLSGSFLGLVVAKAAALLQSTFYRRPNNGVISLEGPGA